MKKIALIVVVIMIALFAYRQLSLPTSVVYSDQEADLILFWGDGCPHCENVKKYIDQNDINSQVKIAQKEVYYNKQNQQQLTDIAKKCPEIDSSAGIGVPFAFSPSESKCLYGDTPIIDWLKNKVQ